jgi:hypothetical protein
MIKQMLKRRRIFTCEEPDLPPKKLKQIKKIPAHTATVSISSRPYQHLISTLMWYFTADNFEHTFWN